MEAGREFQFFEVMGTNLLTNEVVRHFSNLTANECWESAKRVLRAKHALGGITDFNSLLRTEAKVRIYKTMIRPILTYAAETRTDTSKTS